MIYTSKVAREVFLVGPLSTVGIDLARFHSLQFKQAVEDVFMFLSKRYPDARVAVAVYGSASREEMAAKSDADILVISNSESLSEKNFRKEFIKLLEPFGFTKVDVPNWGTVSDLEQIVGVSIVEGNQVIESEAVIGDAELVKRFEKMKIRSSTLERAVTNLVFQKYCFDHYYKKRTKEGLVNIKYSHGGTRDLLFIIWVAKLEALRRKCQKEIRSLTEALDFLHEVGDLSSIQRKKILHAASVMILLRSEVLKVNQSSKHQGLSFFNPKSSKAFKGSQLLSTLFKNSETLATVYRKSAAQIIKTKSVLLNREFSRCLDGEELKLMKSSEKLDSTLERCLRSQQKTSRIICLWELSKRSMNELSQRLLLRYIASNQNTISWEEAAVLMTIEELESTVIDGLVQMAISRQNFGYILKMAAQHQNISKRSLKEIIRAGGDERYIALARVALAKGVGDTNFQT